MPIIHITTHEITFDSLNDQPAFDVNVDGSDTMTVTITMSDPNVAIAIIRNALNAGYSVGIDLDEMDDDATCEDIDQLAQRAFAIGNGVDVGRQKFLDDKLRGLAYALESGDEIAGTTVGSVHYDGPADGTGMYTILFTNGNGWYGRGDEIVTAPEVDKALRGQQDMRQAAYDERMAQVEGAQGFRCPSCHAPKGKPCTTPEGKPYRSFAHIDRVRKFMPKWVP